MRYTLRCWPNAAWARSIRNVEMSIHRLLVPRLPTFACMTRFVTAIFLHIQVYILMTSVIIQEVALMSQAMQVKEERATDAKKGHL